MGVKRRIITPSLGAMGQGNKSLNNITKVFKFKILCNRVKIIYFFGYQEV